MPMTSDPDQQSAVAKRLRRALGASTMTLDELSRRLQPLGVEHTRSTVHRYMSGASEPTLRWVMVAAPILGVRVEWLATGEEPWRISSRRGEQTTTLSRVTAEQISTAPVYFSTPDRVRFGELVRRAMHSLELDEMRARSLLMEMLTAPIAAVAASLKLPGTPEVCLRRFVTMGRPSASSFPEGAHAAEYVTFALNAAARAIPEEPRARPTLPAEAKAHLRRKARKPK